MDPRLQNVYRDLLREGRIIMSGIISPNLNEVLDTISLNSIKLHFNRELIRRFSMVKVCIRRHDLFESSINVIWFLKRFFARARLKYCNENPVT